MTAWEVVFKGNVQGVGFRYTARDIAQELGLTGWVKNFPDGSVHLWAEGEQVLVQELIDRLESHFSVREKQQLTSSSFHNLTDFIIEY